MAYPQPTPAQLAPPQPRVPVSTLRLNPPFKGRITRLPLDAQPEGSVYDSLDMWPIDARTGRARLSVRPGYAAFGSLSAAAGMFTLGAAFNETGGVQLMAATSGNLYRWTGSAWSNVGSITSSTSRTIHAASYGKRLFVACNTTYKYYDYDADDNGTPDHTVATWNATNPDTSVTAGTIPPNCRLVCEWNGRIVLAADPANPHVVNFSRSDNPFDWDFTQEDIGTAIEAPIGEAATALIPHNRDCLIVGTKGGMYIFRGNPAAGGVLEKFAFAVGPVNSSAWCKSADDFTYIMAHDGLYRMAPGCGNPPEDVSRQLIPDALLGIDGTNTKAYLVYDERFRMIHIYCVGTNAQVYSFDVDGGGFNRESSPGSGILAAYRFGLADSATASGSLVATSSGVMRFDSATSLGGSDGAFATLLMQLAPLGRKALVQNASLLFGENTDDTGATVAMYGAESAVAAVALADGRKDSITVGKLQDNHNNWVMPRVGGQSLAIKITQSDTSKYLTFEGGTLAVRPSGRERG